MFEYRLGLSIEEYDAFVLGSKQVSLFQGSRWAIIKNNWQNDRLGVYRDGVLQAVASLFFRPLPAGFSILYSPRGPIMDYEDKELVAFVLNTLVAIGKKRRAIYVTFDPNLVIKSGQQFSESMDQQDILSVSTYLEELGCQWSGRTTDLSETIQPRFQANLYKEEFLLEKLPKRTKQEMRTAKNKGVDVIIGSHDLLEEFSYVISKTEERKEINLRNSDYYRRLLDTYGQDAYITLARIDLPERQTVLRQQITQLKDSLSKIKPDSGKFKENQAALERLLSEANVIDEKLKEGLTTLPLAGTLTVSYGSVSENLYAGMDDAYRHYQAPVLTWYETASEAFRRGSSSHNMGGIENDLSGGLYHFKSKFNPTIEEFVGEFNLPVFPLLYKLANMAYKLRKKWRHR